MPNREYDWLALRLTDWYRPLRPGRYQLIVRKRFVPNGDWAESNALTFDVIPRRSPTSIPEGLKVRLIPEGLKPQPEGKPYHLKDEVHIDVLLANDSDRRVSVSVIDSYYGHRLQLFKDGKLVPYRDDITKLIEAKESTPRLVDVVSEFFIDPKVTRPEGLRLRDWYGLLEPGS